MTDVPVLYTKPKCVQCDATKRKLASAKVEHRVVDLLEDADAMTAIKEMGYLQAPVLVVNETTHWSGHRPDLIEKHLL